MTAVQPPESRQNASAEVTRVQGAYTDVFAEDAALMAAGAGPFTACS
jgi:hypothetical protein